MASATIEKVRMWIDKPRGHQRALRIDHLVCAESALDLWRSPNRNNSLLVHRQRAMLDHCDASERLAGNALLRAGARQELACISDDQVDFLARSLVDHALHSSRWACFFLVVWNRLP